MTQAKKNWETPKLEVFGAVAELTRMPTPPGCDPGDCVSHKGFTNPNPRDGSDMEHSHPPDGEGGGGGLS